MFVDCGQLITKVIKSQLAKPFYAVIVLKPLAVDFMVTLKYPQPKWDVGFYLKRAKSRTM